MIKRTRGLGAAWMGPHSMGHGAVRQAAASASKPGVCAELRPDPKPWGSPRLQFLPTTRRHAGLWSPRLQKLIITGIQGMRPTDTLCIYIAFLWMELSHKFCIYNLLTSTKG